jgi:tetratricopeptide (TPR) repeat protein
VGELRLEVREFQDLTRWRWVLTGPGMAFVADHEVRLDGRCWQYEAFADLLGYLDWHVAPDRLAEDEARIVGEVGTWIGTEVLGPVADALVKARPATVRVIVPPEAQSLLFRPLELAHVNGRPLALQDVTLVMQPGPDDGSNSREGNRLRVLGLFSLPDGGQPLNLRRERHALVRLITGIAAAGKAADVRVLQYGVTRDRLRDVLEEAEGWDVIHISGHGAPGELLLETDAGLPDRVAAGDLADMLDLARDRVKLITVAACWSAALTAAEQRRLLGLPAPRDSNDRGSHDGFAPGALATELTDRLGCAVLAMRYPVGDDFAIALTGKLYDLLADKGQDLPRAVAITLRQITAGAAWPTLSAATPALFGGRAAGLRLAAPPRAHADSYDTGTLKMAGFRPQPDRFVGRTGVMARASSALAADSGIPGVLLHGLPGGGKTACALELAYTHEHAFDRLVWFKAPDEGLDITGALPDFALTLERELPGFQMIHVLADQDKLTAFLPRLTELMEQRRALILIDNMESLLTDGGEWRDARWGKVIGALCAHAGRGRVVLTSRRLPASATGLQVEAVDALSLDEALLLARELPHLRGLIQGELPGVDGDVARRLALGVLNVAQGHPKLLELADGQAADPMRLGALVEAGDQAWREAGGLPDGFFTTGESQADGADYRHVLAAWTQAVTGTLTDGHRTLFWFLCCMEEDDRTWPVADATWACLWNRLNRGGDPPVLDKALAALAASGLIAIQPGPGCYTVHPGVAAAGRGQAAQDLQYATDTELAAYWEAVFSYAQEREGEDRTSGLVVLAGLAAAPYLLRQQQWDTAATLLEEAFERDQSRGTAAAVLPAIQAIAAASHEPLDVVILAKVLRLIDPAAAEQQMRAFLDDALDRGDYQSASAAAGDLAYSCRDSGRLAEALTLAEAQIGYTQRAGLGPWTQLLDQVGRLQVLNDMGNAEQVLAEVQRLREHMDSLPAVPGQNETAIPWSVREVLLDTGRHAARDLGRWQDALDLNAALTTSQHDRGAGVTQIAQTRFHDSGPLIRLGRHEDALDLLLHCRHTFEGAHDIRAFGMTLGALADLEDARGHGDAAITLQRDALRYSYLGWDVHGIAVSHHNLGNYLRCHAHQAAAALTHHLTAALIDALAGAGVEEATLEAASDLQTLGASSVISASVADLCRQVDEIPGADLDRLLAALAPDPDTADRALGELLTRVRELVTGTPTG